VKLASFALGIFGALGLATSPTANALGIASSEALSALATGAVLLALSAVAKRAVVSKQS
jgi:hypothetical protein